MKNSISVWGSALLVGALIIPAVSLAAEVRGGTQVNVASSEVIKNDLYAAGSNVTSSAAIVGDLVIAGGNLLINGAVSEDILAAGGSITLLGTVGDDIRVAGGTIVVSGAVKNDVVAAGGQTEISGPGIGGDVLWAGGSLHVDAPIGGSLQLRGGEAVINSTVRGNVQFKGSKLTLGPKALILGDLDYSAKSEATMEAGASVKGKTTYEPLKVASSSKSATASGIAALLSIIVVWKLLASLVFALALGLIFKRFATTLVRLAMEQPLLETGRGLVVLIVLPIASIMLLVSLIGIPIGILGLVSFVALMLVASCLAAIVMGSLAHKWIFKPAEYQVTWQTILLGVVINAIIALVPIIGGLVDFLFILLALGAMVKIKWDIVKGWR